MNVQDYISSGILESYVLGFCSQEEAGEVENLMAEHVSIREEIRIIQETLELVAAKSAVTPPSHLKTQIWNAIQDETVPVISMHTSEALTNNHIARENAKTRENNWLRYAAVFAVIFSVSSLAVFFYAQNRKMKQQLATVEKTNTTLKDQMAVSSASLSELNEKMKVLADMGTKKVNLAGMPATKDAKAIVYWNADRKKVILTGLSLPDAPSDKQYQLWALVDGVPVDAGVFDLTAENSMVEMKAIEKSQAFAITLEPKGGSPTPHLETLCVMGNI